MYNPITQIYTDRNKENSSIAADNKRMAAERETSFEYSLNTECKYNILNFKDKKDPKMSHAAIQPSKFRDLKSLKSGSP